MWNPIFRYAKHVKLFDRFLGHHLTAGFPHGEPLTSGTRLYIRYNFASGLEWVLRHFTQANKHGECRTFEVMTGLNHNHYHPTVIDAAATALRDLASTLSARYCFPMTMIIKREAAGHTMRHARFLFTDQLALMVDRGFDLLRSDGKVRDVVITHVSDPGKIEREVRDLQDMP